MNAIHSSIQEIRTTVELVRAAQAGDRQAFGELFERFQPTILALAVRRTGNHTEAQELTQDVFVQAMQKLDQLRAPECFPGWLRQITVRMAINRGVRRAPAVAVEPDVLEATLAGESSPLDSAMEGERAGQIRAGLQRLREMDRETLQAFYLQGQTLLQMADRFDAPVGTIKRRLHVARKRLADEVAELAAV